MRLEEIFFTDRNKHTFQEAEISLVPISILKKKISQVVAWQNKSTVLKTVVKNFTFLRALSGGIRKIWGPSLS